MLFFLLACTPTATPEVTLTVGEVPMVPTLTWDGSSGRVHVEGPGVSFDTSAGVPADGIPVFSLAPATDYLLTAIAGDGRALDTVDFRTPELPDALSRTTVAFSDAEASTLGDGLVAMAVAAEHGSTVALVDATGTYRWWFAAEAGMTVAAPRPTLDRDGLWFAQHDAAREVDRGVATRLSWDGRERLDVRTPRGHHMIAELPDGRVATLTHSTLDVAVDDEVRTILSDRIEVVDPYGEDDAEPEVVFDFFDTTEPWVPCGHADHRIDKWDYHGVYEWTHSNSLIHDPDEGRFYLMSWHLDALLAIDDTSGEVVWQLGGRDATRPFADPVDGPFDHGHTSWVDAEQAWVFDNRVHSGSTSRLVRYDLSADPVAITDVIFEAEGRNVGFLGDVQPAPDGHLLGAFTIPGDVVEYDASGRELWRVKLGPGSVLGRVRYVELPR